MAHRTIIDCSGAAKARCRHDADAKPTERAGTGAGTRQRFRRPAASGGWTAPASLNGSDGSRRRASSGLKDLPPIHKTHPQTTPPKAVERIKDLARAQPACGCTRHEAMLALVLLCHKFCGSCNDGRFTLVESGHGSRIGHCGSESRFAGALGHADRVAPLV